MVQQLQQSFRRPESILLVIVSDGRQTLLLRRAPPRGFWQSVTGSMRWHSETAKQAAAREMHEETGIAVELSQIHDWERKFRFAIPKVLRHRYHPKITTNTESMFSVLIPSAVNVTLRPQEHIDYQWTDIDQAQSIVWSWSNREALRLVARSLAD